MNYIRNGKIARLPNQLRHELNLRLQNGDPGRTLAAWLNARADVQAILKEHFAGQPIRQQNLSEWRMGGYQDWLQDQSPEDLSHCLSENATAFTAEHPPLTDALSHWTATRLALRTRRINALQKKDPEAADKLLTKLIRDLTTLQQSQTRVRREQRQRDHLTFRETQAREKSEQAREQTEADHEAWLLHPDNHRYINKLWKEAYPNDFVSDSDEDDEEDNDQSEDVDHESGESSDDQSNEDSVDHPGEDDPTAHRCRDDRTPEQKAAHPAIYVQSRGGRAPIGRTEAHPPRPLPPPIPNTNAANATDPRDDEEEATDASDTSAICHVPSAISPSPTHPVTKSPHLAPPRKPSPTDSSRETVARLLWPKGFAKYGLAVFNHIPLPEEAKKLLSAKIGAHSG